MAAQPPAPPWAPGLALPARWEGAERPTGPPGTERVRSEDAPQEEARRWGGLEHQPSRTHAASSAPAHPPPRGLRRGSRRKGDPRLPVRVSPKLRHDHQPEAERTGEGSQHPSRRQGALGAPLRGRAAAVWKEAWKLHRRGLGGRGHVPLRSRCPSSARGPSPRQRLSSTSAGADGSSPCPWVTCDAHSSHFLTVGC